MPTGLSLKDFIINANFIVHPDDLRRVRVERPTLVRFVESKVDAVGFLGETGKAMASAGFRFIVTKVVADRLVREGVATFVH
jgi:hypothetical protein